MTAGLILILLGAYLLGSVPFGLAVGRLAGGLDIRSAGSGNIGATNVLRTVGKGWGVLTLLLDAAKGAAPAAAALCLWPGRVDLAGLAGLAAFLGHCYPVFLGFRGGKGVATSLGVWLTVAPLAAPIWLAVFLAAVLITKMVSVGSLAASLLMPATVYWLGLPGVVVALAGVIGLVVLVRHRENIQRLMAGQEKRLGRGRR